MALYMKQQKETDVEAESDHYIRVLLRFYINYQCQHLHKHYIWLIKSQVMFYELLFTLTFSVSWKNFFITLATSLLNYNSN